MSPVRFAGILILAMAVSSCGGRQASTNASAGATQPTDRLTTATLTFRTLDDGKDAKSAVGVQLLRNGNELGADLTSSGTEFDDRTTAAPLVMTVRGPFSKQDVQAGQLRLRLTPDGNDTWTFNVGLTLRFADETQRNYSWSDIRLDEKAPERTLVLAGAEGQ